jgi:hypothetical protein
MDPDSVATNVAVIFLVDMVAHERLAGAVDESEVSAGVESIVNVRDTGREVFPAASVVVTLIVLDPSGSGVVGVKLYDPVGDTTPVPMRAPEASRMVNTDPGSQVPLMVGVLSLVRSPFVGLAIVGVAGAVVSICIGRKRGELVFPAISVVVAEREFSHSARGDEGVKLQLPDPSAMTVPSVLPDASFISTVLFASAVPVMAGVESLVRYVGVVSPATLLTVGVAGGRESMRRVTEADGEIFPAISVVVIERVLEPSGRGVVGVNDQLPDPSTVPVPRIVPHAFRTMKKVFASPVPVRVGVVSERRELLVGVEIEGATGAVVSTVKLVVTGAVVLFAPSVRVTL